MDRMLNEILGKEGHPMIPPGKNAESSTVDLWNVIKMIKQGYKKRSKKNYSQDIASKSGATL